MKITDTPWDDITPITNCFICKELFNEPVINNSKCTHCGSIIAPINDPLVTTKYMVQFQSDKYLITYFVGDSINMHLDKMLDLTNQFTVCKFIFGVDGLDHFPLTPANFKDKAGVYILFS